jgi:hypothetical protein
MAVPTPHATCCVVDCLPLVLAPYNHGGVNSVQPMAGNGLPTFGVPLAGAAREQNDNRGHGPVTILQLLQQIADCLLLVLLQLPD